MWEQEALFAGAGALLGGAGGRDRYKKERDGPVFRGKEKQYYPKSLAKGISDYFVSISRERVVTEKVATDRRDAFGHVIYDERPVKNLLGKDITVMEIAARPSVQAICDYLHIRPGTWQHLKRARRRAPSSWTRKR